MISGSSNFSGQPVSSWLLRSSDVGAVASLVDSDAKDREVEEPCREMELLYDIEEGGEVG